MVEVFSSKSKESIPAEISFMIKYVGTANIYQYLKYGIVHLARLDTEKA